MMGLGMPKDKRQEGFHSAAGLIRYFDSEDEKAIKIPPWAVVAMAVATAVGIFVISQLWPVG